MMTTVNITSHGRKHQQVSPKSVQTVLPARRFPWSNRPRDLVSTILQRPYHYHFPEVCAPYISDHSLGFEFDGTLTCCLYLPHAWLWHLPVCIFSWQHTIIHMMIYCSGSITLNCAKGIQFSMYTQALQKKLSKEPCLGHSLTLLSLRFWKNCNWMRKCAFLGLQTGGILML